MKAFRDQRGFIAEAVLIFGLFIGFVYLDQYEKGNDLLAPLTSQTIVQEAGQVAQNAK